MKKITMQTAHTTYQLGAAEDGFLLQLYYGSRVEDDMDYLLTRYDRGFEACPDECGTDRTFSMGVQPAAFPVYGGGDYRTPAFSLKDEDGVYGCDLRYVSHKVSEGKYEIPGLPAVYTDKADAKTVDILMRDARTGTEVTLRYGVLYDLDVITRSVHVENRGQGNVYLERVSSASLDLVSGEYDLIHFYGHHGMERITERTGLDHGVFAIGSKRGTSSHQHNPFVILADRGADEDKGSCYGFSFLYSGNFSCEAEVDSMNQTRIVMGMQPEMFSWKLAPGESFDAPEMMMAFSDQGFAGLSHIFHRTIRRHVVRGPYKAGPRPVLINNWEATYFDFNGEKLLEIARQAKELGVEMMVLDDGWFGHRNSDFEGLGDWWVNEKKLGMTMGQLGDKIHAMGMKFGLWIEPEMVNEDSDLYRAHPDWAFKVPGRQPAMSRNQLVLDLSRPEVVDYLYEVLAKLLSENPIDYVKWDMNRHLADIYSAGYPADRQGEVLHRYVLGLYDLYERLTNAFPDVLWEGCAGGGGRFDAAMLYYSPQIWCSDNTDAVERLYIQEGTSYGYPASAVGAHVSAVPNHQTGRTTPFGTRGTVAMSGGFGYELDLNKITEEEKAEVRTQIERYHEYYDMIHHGDYYRLTQDSRKYDHTAWQFVAEDKGSTLVSMVQTAPRPCAGPIRVRLKGLDPDASYEVVRTEVFGCEGGRLKNTRKVFLGEALMNGGVVLPVLSGSYPSLQMYLKRV